MTALSIPISGQNIIVSKDSLKYLTSLHNNNDSIYIYNTGNNILSIDSMENFNYTYNYLLKYSSKDSIEKSGYVGYYSEIFPSPDLFPIEISAKDSGKFVFQYIPPITKISVFDIIREDSIFIYNNSQNQTVLTIHILNDIPLNINDRINKSFKYKLLQNYPNPFNPFTSIQFLISKRSWIILKVYDILGNEIATLVNEEKLPGNYKVKFDGSKLSSGVYFYKMRAGEFIDTKKFILLK